VQPPSLDDTWCALTTEVLPVEVVYSWSLRPDCGAVVQFSGTARDHSDGRDGVRLLEYEAYEEEVVPKLEAVAADARARWPSVRRVALLHRHGPIELTEAAVLVTVSSPHRADAFEAARFCIDTIKETVPIWKREHWVGGADWARPCVDEPSLASAPEARS
jgi:molybdopterin synthase catalytic subunit